VGCRTRRPTASDADLKGAGFAARRSITISMTCPFGKAVTSNARSQSSFMVSTMANLDGIASTCVEVYRAARTAAMRSGSGTTAIRPGDSEYVWVHV